MNARIPKYNAAHASSGRNSILWLLAAGCLLLIVLGLLRQRPNDNPTVLQGPATAARPAASEDFANAEAQGEYVTGLVEQIARASGMRIALLFNEHDAGTIKVSCRTSAWAPSTSSAP